MPIIYRTIIAAKPTQHALATLDDSIHVHSSYDVAFLRLRMAVTARYAPLLPRISEEYGEARDSNTLFLGWIERHVVADQVPFEVN